MILVTGGAGFIGTNFILDCLKYYDDEIINLDKLTYASNLENFESTKNYDVITLIEVIEHLYSPITTIRKIREIMNKDTILIVSTPYQLGFPFRIIEFS